MTFISDFNSQPHKEADITGNGSLFQPKYFNSQPHKEADHTKTAQKSGNGISTHSLTRRLTRSGCHIRN